MLQGTRREAAAEFFGTFIPIDFGVGVVAQTVLSHGANGSCLAINLGWGLAVMLGVYVAGGVSGAHLNPAVTVALAVRREDGGTRQVLGPQATAGIFATYPQAYLSLAPSPIGHSEANPREARPTATPEVA